MKSNALILFALVILFSACRNDEFVEPDTFNDQQEDGFDDNNQQNNLEGALTLYKVSGNQIDKVKDYQVSTQLLAFQKDYTKHLAMWEYVVRLFAIEDRDKISEFEVFHGGGELAGYVIPTNSNLSKWRMGLAIDEIADLENINLTDFFTYVTIHEYGHIITLNDNQVDANGDFNCDHYFTGEGCSYDRSYINKIFELGWTDIIDRIDEEDPGSLYENYPERFVSEYAATNPGEDVAEVFATFVTKDEQPMGNSIADQKVKLLYQFSELVDLREKIRQNVDVQALVRSNWRTDPRFSKMRICGHRGCKHNK